MKAVLAALALTSLITPYIHASDYQGQDKREIKSFSAQDIESIKKGKGWGMAKPAELNGYPGPSHVLDLADELKLSSSQQVEMEKLFNAMQEQAIEAGERFLEAERQLDAAFRSKQITNAVLKELIDISARARADLRHVHLSTHLESIKFLSSHQVTLYNQLRGYHEPNHHHHSH